VRGHFEISPGRKEDPTPLMPWDRMRAALGPRTMVEFHPAHAVKEMQAALAELGYPVGKVDGLMGQRTRAAIFAFQQQNKLAATGSYDAATENKLFHPENPPKEMPIGTRAETTAADLRAGGSVTTYSTAALKGAAGIAAGIQVGSSLMDMTSAVNDLSSTVTTVETALKTADRVDALVPKLAALLTWSQSTRGLVSIAMLVLLAGMWILGKVIEARRVGDAKSGANAK